MKKLMTTAVALFVVGGVTAVAADVTISGNSRFRYHTWSDDNVDPAGSGNNNNEMSEILEIWVNGDMVADNGLSYGMAARFRKAGNVDRNYVYLKDDWGQIKAGRDWAPIYNMSLGADWRGSVAGSYYVGGAGSRGKVKTGTYTTISEKNLKLAYYTPSVGGFKAGVSFADGGDESKANATSVALNYTMNAGSDSKLRIGYGLENAKAPDGKAGSVDTKLSELGVEFTAGDFLASIVRFTDKNEINFDNGTVIGNNSDQEGTEVELAYNVSDNLLVNAVLVDSKERKGANDGDTFKATQLGVKYTIAPGLFLGLLHNKHKYKDSDTPAVGNENKDGDNDGTSTRVELRVNF